MAASSSGIWTNAATIAAQPNSTANDDSGSSGTDSATISANDFLTLLVTEMQNQDPTATNDPNEYINQLVNVNSLEQLISINQTLQSATGSSTSTANPGAAKPTAASQAVSSLHAQKTAGSANTQSLTAPRAPGNLSVPKSNPAAKQMATALLHE